MKKDTATIIQAAVTSLLTSFQREDFPVKAANTFIRKQAGDTIPADSWSFSNRMLMTSQGTEDARGFTQWQAVNRHVKKGASAIYIFAPLTKKIEEKNESTGEISVKIIITGFKPIPVFRVEDTDGEPLPVFDYAPKTFPPFFDVADKIGLSVEYTPLRSNFLGRFLSNTSTLELCSEDAVVYYHELAHAVHNSFVNLATYNKDKAEIVAEFSACTLCELSGINGYQWQGYEYIRHYCSNESDNNKILKKIMSILSDVEKIVSIVLDTTTDTF